MSIREWKRLNAVERVAKGELGVAEAAKVLGLSERQLLTSASGWPSKELAG